MLFTLMALMLGVGLVPMMVEPIYKRFDPFNLKNAFIVYYLLQLGVSGIPALTTGEASIFGPNPIIDRQFYEIALALSLAGLVCFQLGYYTTRARLALWPVFLYRWPAGRTRTLATIYIMSGFAALAALLSLPGVADYRDFINQWRGGELTGIGPVTFAATTLPSIGMLLWAAHKGKDLRLLPFALIATAALAPALVMGFRYLFILPILQSAVIWHYLVRRFTTASIVVLAMFCGLAFTAYGIWRAIPAGIDLDWDVAAQVAADNSEVLYDVALRSKGLEVVASVVKKLDDTGDYQLGVGAPLEAVTSTVPRALWPGKPISNGERFVTYFFGADLAFDRNDYVRDVWGGISPTVVGELYWHFWWPGVLIGMFLLGLVARLAYNTLRANQENKAVVLYYAIFFTHFLGMAEAPQGYLNSLVTHSIAFLLTVTVLALRLVSRPA